MLQNDAETLIAALEWQIAMGAEDAILEDPVNRYAWVEARRAQMTQQKSPPQRSPHPSSPHPGPSEIASPGSHRPSPSGTALRPTASSDAPLGTADAAAAGAALASTCMDLPALQEALSTFDGCELKMHATNLVFGDGNPSAEIMMIGEAPGRDEDREGKPFVGVSGQLLDRMLSYIGLTREGFYITNGVYWRPPGNRKPNDGEIAVCRPFLDRQISLVQPKVLVLIGDKSARSLAGVTTGITRSRGQWYDVKIGDEVIPALTTLHPAYLLRTPAAKKQAWQDLITLRRKLDQMGISPL